jgi:hypothetical protein
VPFAEALHNNLLANGALHHQPPPPGEASHAKAHSAGVGA